MGILFTFSGIRTLEIPCSQIQKNISDAVILFSSKLLLSLQLIWSTRSHVMNKGLMRVMFATSAARVPSFMPCLARFDGFPMTRSRAALVVTRTTETRQVHII